ncbi:MAG: IPT/TIG domain-containing protein [Candidatus Dormiibacterota bacterium]
MARYHPRLPTPLPALFPGLAVLGLVAVGGIAIVPIAALAAWVGNDSNHGNTFTTAAYFPTASLSPTSGPVGTVVTISGSGFPANATITATFAGVAVTLSGTTTTTASGGIPTSAPPTFTVPATAPGSLAGAHAVVVTAGGYPAPSVSFTVTPSISLNPTGGTKGSSITITGNGFAANSKLTVTFNGTSTAWTSNGGAETTNANGAIPANATINAGSEGAGSYTVKVTDAAGNSASATYSLSN